MNEQASSAGVERVYDRIAALYDLMNAAQGLHEARRVVKLTGCVLLLEHVRPRNPLLGKLFDLLSPLTR